MLAVYQQLQLCICQPQPTGKIIVTIAILIDPYTLHKWIVLNFTWNILYTDPDRNLEW